jgi:hypothetical protein
LHATLPLCVIVMVPRLVVSSIFIAPLSGIRTVTPFKLNRTSVVIAAIADRLLRFKVRPNHSVITPVGWSRAAPKAVVSIAIVRWLIPRIIMSRLRRRWRRRGLVVPRR